VILVDANLLVYAHVSDMKEHEAARAWLDDSLNSSPRVGLPWTSLTAFLRIVTNPRIFPNPETMEGAWRQVAEWIGARPAWIPVPTDGHAEIFGGLLDEIGGRSDLVPDAHLAALAMEHGLVLCSTDADFARFRELRWRNPLS
jgi:toxin-antitoxin system PIN domain toxin